MNACAGQLADGSGDAPVVPYTNGDDVYRERACLLAHLARQYPGCWWADPREPDWPIVYLETEAGQVSWHIAACDVELFPALPTVERNPWDGHDTAEKYRRLAALPVRTRTCAHNSAADLPETAAAR